jgi:hypothetical protein
MAMARMEGPANNESQRICLRMPRRMNRAIVADVDGDGCKSEWR